MGILKSTKKYKLPSKKCITTQCKTCSEFYKCFQEKKKPRQRKKEPNGEKTNR